MTAARPARLRPGAEQHLVQRRGRHDARHPRRAVGQVGLGRHRADLRRVGRPARRARRSAPSSPPSSTRRGRSSCRAASATPTRPSSPTPPTRTSSTTTGRPTRAYTFLNLADETVAIAWPIPLDRRRDLARRTSRTRAWPRSTPIAPRKTLVLGAGGQLGLRAARRVRRRRRTSSTRPAPSSTSTAPGPRDPPAAGATTTRSSTPPPTPPSTWPRPPTGARDAWAANVAGVAAPRARSPPRTASRSCTSPATTSSTAPLDRPYREDDAVCPLGVYGQTKAAGDAVVATVPRHYIVRTSWVIGDGKNFVRTMASLAERGIDPKVVDDQIGRLTFTDDLARGIRHLLDTRRRLRHLQPHRRGRAGLVGGCRAAGVRARPATTRPASPASPPRSTSRRRQGPVAPRPRNSVLDRAKLRRRASGPPSGADAWPLYLAAELAGASADRSPASPDSEPSGPGDRHRSTIEDC